MKKRIIIITSALLLIILIYNISPTNAGEPVYPKPQLDTTEFVGSETTSSNYIYICDNWKFETADDDGYFDSVEDCQAWLDNNKIPLMQPAGQLEIGKAVYNKEYLCGYYSYQLMLRALRDGWLITDCPVYLGRIWGFYATPIGGDHKGCWTRIGDYQYYIEVIPENKVSFTLKKINIPIEGKYK